MLLASGVMRTLWLGLFAVAPHGLVGVLIIATANFLLLLSAGIFNPTFVNYRMRAIRDSHMSRVATAWSISSRTRTFQPLFIVMGGVLAAATSTRFALASAAVLLLGSALLLPWRTGWTDGVVPPG